MAHTRRLPRVSPGIYDGCGGVRVTLFYLLLTIDLLYERQINLSVNYEFPKDFTVALSIFK